VGADAQPKRVAVPVNRPYEHLQVLEIATGLAAEYCGKLFVDAGADVVKVEPSDADPMRRWTTSGEPPSAAEAGALFQYLSAGKRSVSAAGAGEHPLCDRADLVVLDGSLGWDRAAVARLSASHPWQVVVSVSRFGLSGPYAGLDVNEFVLQAMCGSATSRGVPEGAPLQAGGRIGEWVTGAYAAVAAAAVLRRVGRTGHGDLVDVSMYEAMVSTMGGLGAISRSVLKEDSPIGKRSIELPSIVATADGLVGFCTITRQQFTDFLLMIGRPDLLEDDDLANVTGRMRRRHEFQAMVEPWAAQRSTAEIIELAASLRIPVAPIGTPDTVTSIDHFVERGVFVKAGGGAFVAPRPPYRSDGLEPVPFGDVPRVAEHDGGVAWTERVRPSADDREPGLPLDGLRVLDFTAFWAGPAATHLLACLGADVIKVEGLRRPDGIRYAGGRPVTEPRWWEWGPLFLAYNTNKRGVTIELGEARGRELALGLVARCDLVMENFSPRVMDNFGLDWDTLRGANPRLVMVRMPAFGLDGPWRDRVGFAQTMEQASGMAWMTGEADGLPLIPRGPCDPVSGLHAAFAALAALEVRDRTGAGMHVESTMVEAVLNISAEPVLEFGAYGRIGGRAGNRGPGAAPQGLYRCAGDDDWVALAVTDNRHWTALVRALGEPAELTGVRYASMAGRRDGADAIDAVISSWTATRTATEAEQTLRAHGVPSSRLHDPDLLLADPHLADRGFWQPVHHPVAGTCRLPGMPFRLARSERPWLRAAAPTLGQHNHEVFTQLLDMTADQISELEQAALIGDRPAGL
jgi:crotonobetainyl-CoA:carnitine CoA-transferase CaiB-like acyl-CoA transferase